MGEPFEDTDDRAREPAVPVTAGDAGTGRLRRLVVVGSAMVAQRLVEALLDRADRDDVADAPGSGGDRPGGWVVDVLTEEPNAPDDRVGPMAYLAGRTAQDLLLGDLATWDRPGVGQHLGARAYAAAGAG